MKHALSWPPHNRRCRPFWGAAEQRLPEILDDIGEASDQIEALAITVSRDLMAASGGIDTLVMNANGALVAASETFANANETLSAINAALATGETTLNAATGAFEAAEGAIMMELGAFIARLRQTLDGLDVAVGQVAEDLPEISDNLSAASVAAEQAFVDIAGAVRAASPAVQEFATSGLPEYAQFARDARALATSLDRLIRQIERDPSRFFLGEGTPEFRR